MNTRCPPKRVPSAALFFTLSRLTVQPPQSYSVGGQRSSGQLTGKPAGAWPDYRGRWCALNSSDIPQTSGLDGSLPSYSLGSVTRKEVITMDVSSLGWGAVWNGRGGKESMEPRLAGSPHKYFGTTGSLSVLAEFFAGGSRETCACPDG
ncbi:UNVERIFIED_CONTAM: hypothetical protein FKN15_039457 [Acipenser sinensis]